MATHRWCWLTLWIATCSCSGRFINSQVHDAERDFKDHIGFVLFDPVKDKTIYDHQGDRYFTPASNTKIFTFYASLKLLGDSIPAFRYVQRGDSLIFWGTGDPGFLYEKIFPQRRIYDFLQQEHLKLYFSSSNFFADPFGPGWAWDDYGFSFQAERTPFPVYGNQVKVILKNDSVLVAPRLFKQQLTTSPAVKEKPMVIRDLNSNNITYWPGVTRSERVWQLPFHYDDALLVRLLSDTLKKEVKMISLKTPPTAKTFYGEPSDSLFKVMMQQSDNFIAEQLLLLCASKVSDTLRSEITIDYVKKNFLNDLSDEPVWIDGSGLSRYNLFTPRSIVAVWEKIYHMMPRERLFSLLAIGGKSGTLMNYYKSDKPYVFGKTGTLSNQHSLSGFLVTRRGTTLIFSWMNNNFTRSSSEVRTRMETVLKTIYEKY